MEPPWPAIHKEVSCICHWYFCLLTLDFQEYRYLDKNIFVYGLDIFKESSEFSLFSRKQSGATNLKHVRNI